MSLPGSCLNGVFFSMKLDEKNIYSDVSKFGKVNFLGPKTVLRFAKQKANDFISFNTFACLYFQDYS